MLFSDVLGAMKRTGDAWEVPITADWLQGRSAFGGLQAALALRALEAIAPEHPLRVLQTTFIAPVSEGIARIETRPLRFGKTTVHAEARIFDGDTLAAVVVGVFGKSRPSEIRVAPRPRVAPPMPPPVSAAPSSPDRPRFLPAFLQHFDVRWLRGAPPGSGSPLPEAIVEISLRDSGATTAAHVCAIADATPPIGLSMLKTASPGSSLTWTLEMLREGGFADLALDRWRLDVEIVAAGGGYTSQSEIVWGPGGEAIAVSRQCMVIFG